jgi:glucose-6-phosphate 1-epimerase
MADQSHLLEEGINGLPKVRLESPGGASAEIYLHGAHVTSWKTPDGIERLYLSKRAVFQEGKAIRGGVPICFPQFAELGNLPKHGFARTMEWELVDIFEDLDDPDIQAQFRLVANDDTRRLWQYDFVADFAVTIAERWLILHFTVMNTGDAPLTFTGALHTYLAVEDIHQTFIDELLGATYLDAADGGRMKTQTSPDVSIVSETDSVYFDEGYRLMVRKANRGLFIEKFGFPDTVIWNIWDKAATLADMEPDDYLRYLCVEAAIVEKPVTLAPGERWTGWQTIVAN